MELMVFCVWISFWTVCVCVCGEQKLMRQEDDTEGEVRDLKSRVSKVQSENRGMGSKLASQKEQSQFYSDFIVFVYTSFKGCKEVELLLATQFISFPT